MWAYLGVKNLDRLKTWYLYVVLANSAITYLYKTFLYLQDSRQTLASRRKLLPVSPMIKPKKALHSPPPLLDGENQVPGLHAFDVDAESGRKRWTIEPYRSRMLQALNLVGKGISKQKACNLCKVGWWFWFVLKFLRAIFLSLIFPVALFPLFVVKFKSSRRQSRPEIRRIYRPQCTSPPNASNFAQFLNIQCRCPLVHLVAIFRSVNYNANPSLIAKTTTQVTCLFLAWGMISPKYPCTFTRILSHASPPPPWCLNSQDLIFTLTATTWVTPINSP